MTRSQSGVLHTQFCLMAAHSSGNLTISVDGSDFNAVSLTSPAPDDLEESTPKRVVERQSHIALALGSSADSAAWSSSLLVSLEPESFFTIVRNEVILVPVYNASTRTNDCFYPIRVDTKTIDGVDTIVFSPFAVLTNSLREAILVNSAGFVRSIEPGETCPYMTRQMDNRTDRFVFSIKGLSQGSYSWSDEAKLIEDSTDFVLVTSVCSSLSCCDCSRFWFTLRFCIRRSTRIHPASLWTSIPGHLRPSFSPITLSSIFESPAKEAKLRFFFLISKSNLSSSLHS